MKKVIPECVLNILGSAEWSTDECNMAGYDEILKNHSNGDNRDGKTSAYIYRVNPESSCGRFTTSDIIQMIEVIPPEMVRYTSDQVLVNQHYIHSIGQYMANSQHSWNLHLERMSKIIGSASGKI